MSVATEPKRVLLAEDENLVATVVGDMLEELGYVLHDNPPTVAAALSAVAAGGFDVAVLDVNLAGQSVFPVADALDAAGIPFIFASGYGAAGLPDAWRGHPVAAKPFRIDDLESVLSMACRERQTQ